ncbi:serine hydrolase domain-containing protein [Anaerotignum propionicum]|uniref:serine hydrolase domain-containing protein n=1 Tax=Anaerotignum propionicum TaxID=28446 RepID=UPI00210A0A58|nr:serine hydrolase [Anaerotignum propionicum]MCQ4937421.1 beta-lactamase family protein [Anaerotignum propionicum]
MNEEKIKEFDTIIQRDYQNIAGIVAEKKGVRVYENYFNGYTSEHTVHVASVTKSVFSVLLGIAIELGYIKSIEQKVLDFFPEYQTHSEEKTIQKITIKNLLTMTAPYKYKVEPYEMFFTSQNPIQDALNFLGGDNPIGEFYYSAVGGTHILSGILMRSTGQSVLEFGKKHLFEPLGIDVTQNVILRNKEEHISIMNDKYTRGWVVDPQGRNMASWGLFLTPSDMVKIGNLYENGGMWSDKKIVTADWIDKSTMEQSRCVEWGNLGYGYLWWIIDQNSYAALGDGGNAIYVNRKKNIVVSIASFFMPDAKDRIALIKKYIEPMIEDSWN